MELGTQELAMSVEEAEALVAAAGVEASANQIEELLHRTEGWPVGLYLAALAKQSGMQSGRMPSAETIVGSATTCAPSCCPVSAATT